MNGIIPIYKPAGFTSFDIVAIMRRLTGVRKIGHSGTLDPMATGVLPTFIGAATKSVASERFTVDSRVNPAKEYVAEFRLGITTDTQDSSGRILSESAVNITRDDFEAAAADFVGEIRQIPPMYSAVKVGGRKLCDIVRKGGEVAEIERKPRRVTIHAPEILSFDEVAGTGTIRVACSKGTYIRTLLHDIGGKLGCGAIMTALERTRSDGFGLEDCHDLEKLRAMSAAQIEELLLPWGRNIALGVFDGVHIGHAQVLQNADAAFTFCDLPSGEKIISFEKRRNLLNSRGIKDVFAYEFAEVCDLSAEEFVRDILRGKLKGGVVTCGENFRFAKGASADVRDLRRICGEYGIEVRVVAAVEHEGVIVSSTRIRAAICGGDIVSANTLLGRDLSYSGVVIEGAKIGRAIGFPTANMRFPDGCVLPRFGVYRSRVYIGGESYSGVTNIGVKPTLTQERVPLIETHILDFDCDIYGQKITVSLQSFVRGERKFSSLDALKNQIKTDIEGN